MTALVSYSTGLATVAAGGTSVTGSGTIWSGVNARPGDVLQIGNFQSIVSDVVGLDELTIPPWGGGAQTAVAYKIWQVSPQRFAGAQAMADVSTLVAALNKEGFYWFVDVDETEPDPSLGNDGQYASQPITGKLWLKDAGVWGFLGIYKAFRLKGAWSGATAYVVGDVVTLSGSSYVCALDHTNHMPPNTTYWQLLAAKGTDGAAATVSVGTVTTGAGGSAAAVANSGSSSAAILDFTIPAGKGYGGTSTTSRTIGAGPQAFTTQSGLAYQNGARVRATATAGATGWLEGVATYSGTTLTITSDKTGGSGTGTAWNFNVVGEPGAGDVSSANALSEYTGVAAAARVNLGIHQNESLGTGHDFNAATNAGSYYTQDGTCTNTPSALNGGDNYFILEVVRGVTSSYVHQRAIGENSGLIFHRLNIGGAWTAWKQIPSDAATKAQQETGTSNAVATTPANQKNHDSAAKAWAIFNAAGTIMASHGIASVSKAGTGQWVVTFSTAFASAVNYVAIGSVEHNAANTFLKFGSGGGKTASGINVYVLNTAQVLTDPDYVSVVFYGRQ